ncbi:MAG: sigma 54-interacting transcriptional regulator, partial [Desulfobacterales bacterium]|nr:sigma 54-interacting transcriptional regulator [Desulfobacterales bacterium]
MKNIQYNIRLNVIVPCITAGIAVLTFIVAFQITKYYIGKGDADYIGIVIVYGVVATVISLMTGILITRILLKPMQQFIENAKQLPAIASQVISSGKEKNVDELKHFSMIFEQVAEVLSKVESRQFFPDITGESRAIRGVLNQIIKVAPTDSTVLVYGESGTGKELVAKNIYEHSIRKDKAFVKINCVAIPEELLESELFGHEKGSFTGASSRKLGKFEIADGGTIFLDEIGDMSLRLQAKILRVLQEREFDRVGGTNPIKVDVRFIAATNKNLEELVKDGKFREDLFYRLNVFVINIPPLRNRIEDIPLLVDSFYENS